VFSGKLLRKYDPVQCANLLPDHHTIFLEMDGTIDSPNSMGPLKNLGFDHQQIAKIAVKLDAHSVQCAYKHVGI